MFLAARHKAGTSVDHVFVAGHTAYLVEVIGKIAAIRAKLVQ